jgi:hypothetical protein
MSIISFSQTREDLGLSSLAEGVVHSDDPIFIAPLLAIPFNDAVDDGTAFRGE